MGEIERQQKGKKYAFALLLVITAVICFFWLCKGLTLGIGIVCEIIIFYNIYKLLKNPFLFIFYILSFFFLLYIFLIILRFLLQKLTM